jgi:hypothetical protein
MIETPPQEAVAPRLGDDLGRHKAVQHLNRAAVSARGYNWDD